MLQLPKLDSIPTADQIIQVHRGITPMIRRTPLFHTEYLDELCEATVYLKAENMQKIGAFKMRGASSAILALTPEERLKGVCTHSSGNHAQAIALAAKLQHISAYIVMPENAPTVKYEGTIRHGAQVTFCAPTVEAREETLKQVMADTGSTFVHPYNNYNVIAGQATAAKETIEDAEVDVLITPVGGGGLLSGTALWAHYAQPSLRVYGAEPSQVDDAARSFHSGKIEKNIATDTIADGLRTNLGDYTFEIIKQHVAGIFTVTEEEILAAMKLIWQFTKLIIEPSSAVPVAVLLKNKNVFKGQRIGLILSGGNVDLDHIPFNLIK